MNQPLKKIKVVLTDLDGTVVLPGANTASKVVIDSIRLAERHGVKFAAVTGRPFNKTQKLLKQIGFRDPCIFDGGATIANPKTGEIIWSRKIPTEIAKKAIEILEGQYVKLEFEDNQKYNAGQPVDFTKIMNPVLSIWASVPIEKADSLLEKLNQLHGIVAHGNPGPNGDFSLTGVQVTNIEADKEHAVKKLLAIDGTDVEHTIAIGDGDNDIPLFQSAGLKVAMGNSTKLLKEMADTVVSNVEKDGFAEAIHKLVIGNLKT